MTALPHASLSYLLEKIETLYQTALNLTLELEEETQIDRQMSIEEIRKATFSEADQMFEAVASAIENQSAAEDPINEREILERKERILRLACQIRSIDQKRAVLIEKEQSEVKQELARLHLGKQALTQYQKAIPIET